MDYKHVIVGLVWAAFVSLVDFAEGRTLSDLLSGLHKLKVSNNDKNASAVATPQSTEKKTWSSSPFVNRIKDISLVSADLMHGDYVGASIDAVDFLETFDNFQWPIKVALKLAKEILKIIHPVFLKLFPDAKNDGNLIESFMFSVYHGGGILKNVLKIMTPASS